MTHRCMGCVHGETHKNERSVLPSIARDKRTLLTGVRRRHGMRLTFRRRHFCSMHH